MFAAIFSSMADIYDLVPTPSGLMRLSCADVLLMLAVALAALCYNRKTGATVAKSTKKPDWSELLRQYMASAANGGQIRVTVRQADGTYREVEIVGVVPDGAKVVEIRVKEIQ